METLFIFKDRWAMDKNNLFRSEGDIVQASMSKHLDNIDFGKYKKVVGVNLGIRIKTSVSEICDLNNIEFVSLEGGKAWDFIHKKKKEIENEKFIKLSNKLEGEKISKWDFDVLKKKIYNRGKHLYISVNRPNNYYETSIYEPNVLADRIDFNIIKCLSDNSILSQFVDNLELNTYNVYRFEDDERRLLVYISENDYLYIRKANID